MERIDPDLYKQNNSPERFGAEFRGVIRINHTTISFLKLKDTYLYKSIHIHMGVDSGDIDKNIKY